MTQKRSLPDESLDVQIKKKTAEIRELEKSLKDTKEQLLEFKENLQSSREDVDKYDQRVKAQNKELIASQNKLERIQSRLKIDKKAIEPYEQAKKVFETIIGLPEKVTVLSEDLSKKMLEIDKLTQENAKLISRVKEMEKQSKGQLTLDIRGVKNQIENNKDKITKLNDDFNQLNTELKKSYSQYDDALNETKKEFIRERILPLNADVSDPKVQNDMLKIIESKIQIASPAIEKASSEQTQLATEIESTKKQVDEMKSILAAKRELFDLEARPVRDKENSLSGIEHQIDQERHKLAELVSKQRESEFKRGEEISKKAHPPAHEKAHDKKIKHEEPERPSHLRHK